MENNRFKKWLIDHPQQGLSLFFICLSMWAVLFWHMWLG